MTVDCVEEPGEGEAEDGAEEKHPNYYLLLEWSHKRHVGSEHVHETQAEEEQTACRKEERGTVMVRIRGVSHNKRENIQK